MHRDQGPRSALAAVLDGSTATLYPTLEVNMSNPPTPILVTLPDNGTTREYARFADSPVLDPFARSVLQAAANGEPVDLRTFQKSLTYALSACSTRFGQSMTRRNATRKVRHLIHWADAILDDHLQGTPSFDSTEARSRKVAELSAEVERLRSEAAEVERTRTTLVDPLRATLDYARSLLDEVDDARVQGFLRGYQTKP